MTETFFVNYIKISNVFLRRFYEKVIFNVFYNMFFYASAMKRMKSIPDFFCEIKLGANSYGQFANFNFECVGIGF